MFFEEINNPKNAALFSLKAFSRCVIVKEEQLELTSIDIGAVIVKGHPHKTQRGDMACVLFGVL